jgi:hypothetical protein
VATHSEAFLKYLRNYNRERRALLKTNGLCVDCGSENATPGHSLGENCRKTRVERYHARYSPKAASKIA